MSREQFIEDLDAASKRVLTSGEPRRTHLGASEIGERCSRKIWYGFRWAGYEDPGGRMHRLWNRGHEEEHRVVRWLRAMEIEVRDYQQKLMYHDASDSYVCIDWDDEEWSQELDEVWDDPVHLKRAAARNQAPKQWNFAEDLGDVGVGEDPRSGEPHTVRGHFSGSGDGQVSQAVAKWFPEIEGLGWGLFENKTHKQSYFAGLVRKGMVQDKPSHHMQMQMYMHELGLKWGLYVAVNKDTDEIYVEVVHYKPEVARPLVIRARQIITMREAPPRMTQDPSFFECRFCHHRELCHYDGGPDKNCRSCVFAQAMTGKRWRCNKFDQIIPKDFIPQGCDQWESIS